MSNPLQEHAHLFANGKFKIKYKDYFGETQIGEFDGLHLELMNDDCTLIARPIEDLSNEEVNKSAFIKQLRDNPDIASCHDLDGKEMIYLLSIGVYPFDQKAFQAGEVININEV